MAYGLGDVTDEGKAGALEAQASDMDRIATSLESSQPSAATALKTQAIAMRQQAAAFRSAAGLASPGAWSTGAKIGAATGVAALVVGAFWLGRARSMSH